MTIRNPKKEDTRKLTFVVIYMSMFVLVLYGLGPLV
jgi:preprotein translocase subunit SecE